MHIVYVSPFFDPFSSVKTQIGSKLRHIVQYLPKKHKISILLPAKYLSEKNRKKLTDIIYGFEFNLGGKNIHFKVYSLINKSKRISVNIIDFDEFIPAFDFNIDEKILFGILFSTGSALYLLKNQSKPGLIHSLGWSTYLFPVIYRIYANDYELNLVHSPDNIYKQVVISREWLEILSLPRELYNIDQLEYYGHINLLKGAVKFSESLIINSTKLLESLVNPLESVPLTRFFIHNRYKLKAINEVIDSKEWNPSTDPYIASKYSRSSLHLRTRNKIELQHSLGLKPGIEIPVIGIIIDFLDNDYVDLIYNVLSHLLAHPVQCILCSIKDQYLFRKISLLDDPVNNNFIFIYGLDLNQVHMIFSSADLFIITPQVLKPFINHIIALAYGCIPIANHSPFFKDHITDIQSSHAMGNGYLLHEYSADALFSLIIRSIKDYRNKSFWTQVQERAMSADFSYKRVIGEYLQTYRING